MIDRVLIAIGGIGSRYGCPEIGLPSKCFIKFDNKTLIEYIFDMIIQLRSKPHISIVLTTVQQEDMCKKVLYNYNINYDVLYNIKDDAFYSIQSCENTLIIYGDTFFFNRYDLKNMENIFLQYGESVYMLIPTKNGIDDVVFRIDFESKIINNVYKGQQILEASQVYLFSKRDSKIIMDYINSESKYNIIYKYLMPQGKSFAYFGNCVNINTQDEYTHIRHIYKGNNIGKDFLDFDQPNDGKSLST